MRIDPKSIPYTVTRDPGSATKNGTVLDASLGKLWKMKLVKICIAKRVN